MRKSRPGGSARAERQVQAAGRAQVDLNRLVIGQAVHASNIEQHRAADVLDGEGSADRPAGLRWLDRACLEGDDRPPVGGEETRAAQVLVAARVAGADAAGVELGAEAAAGRPGRYGRPRW